MSTEQLRNLIEFSMIGILGFALLTLIYMYISRRAAFSIAKEQLHKFETKTELEIELYKKINLVYTIASNAVYIGLFGTVVGILIALQNVDVSNKSELIASLSIPLISTAASIVVAIIGNFIYNALITQIEYIIRLWEKERA